MKALNYWLKTSLAFSLALGCVGTYPIFAAEAPTTDVQPNIDDEVNQVAIATDESENPFENVEPTDSILPLEDGGFLIGSGEVEIFSIDDLDTPIETIDLDSNPNAVTKEKAYSLLVNQEKEATVNPQQDIIVPARIK